MAPSLQIAGLVGLILVLQVLLVWLLWIPIESAAANIITASGGYAPKNKFERLVFACSGWWAAGIVVVLLTLAGLIPARRDPPRIFLRAKRDLAPFTALHLDDFDEAAMNAPPPDAIDKSKFVDAQMTVSAIPRKAVLTKPFLLDIGRQGIGNWQVLTARAISPPPTAGEQVTLFGLKENAADAECVADGVVALGLNGADVIVAVSPEQAESARKFLIPNRSLWAVRTVDTRSQIK